MLNQTRKFIKLILPKKIFVFIKIIYESLKFRSLKYLYYNKTKDLEFNEKNLINLSIENKQILSVFKNFELDYYNEFLSWHYHVLAGLSKNSNNLNILEIGTHIGHFTRFISEIFDASTIYSVDLHRESKLFKNIKYDLDDEDKRNIFLKQRSINLEKKILDLLK